jgi:3-deoxy-D-manno-octulosonic-acid transferase
MYLIAYNLFLILYKCALHIASLWHIKAKEMIVGRKNIFEQIALNHQPNKQTIWMHCASVGEYEQGLPIVELLKNKYPNCRIVLTFFSPSGFKAFKPNTAIDEMYYLPLDSKLHASQFIQLIQPKLAIFVKYELWFYYLQALHHQQIPIYMVSMYVTSTAIFGKWYGVLHRQMLGFFTIIFVQNEASKTNLAAAQIANVIVAGDTRYDRIVQLTKTAFQDEKIENFCARSRVLIAGSTWPQDEELLCKWWQQLPANHGWKLIIVPHQLELKHIADIQKMFEKDVIKYTDIHVDANKKVLILNTMGMLKYIYPYAMITYIGGGFGAGIHNILEPIGYGKTVLHGPNINRFLEAKQFGQLGISMVVNNYLELDNNIKKMLVKAESNKQIIQAEIDKNIGASEMIVGQINF